MNTDTAIKLEVSTAPRSRAPEMADTYPRFYLAALEAENKAAHESDQAYYRWMCCPSYAVARRAELMDDKKRIDEDYADTRAAVNMLYEHWQRLCHWSRQECECDDPERTCKPCRARARLNDPEYTPTVATLLHEEF